nr:nuclear transport factor 2 family protein [Rhodococcus sp. (in: high G+C Gram-positive bacteria)]
MPKHPDVGRFPVRVESPEHWIELFAEAFEAGNFASVARLAELTHPRYRAVQPQNPDAVGPEGMLNFFARVYALMPDLRGEIVEAHTYDNGVYIEVRLVGTIAGRPLSWISCDRFWFDDGLVKGRVSFYDPTSLAVAVATRPRAWGRWWQSGLGYPVRKVAARLDPRLATAD